jgi:solute carrier family 35 protein F5
VVYLACLPLMAHADSGDKTEATGNVAARFVQGNAHADSVAVSSLIEAPAVDASASADETMMEDQALLGARGDSAQPSASRLPGSIGLLPRRLAVVEGVACLLAVAAIWVGASVLVQYMYSDLGVHTPFFITYFCNSLFVTLLPWRALRERGCSSSGVCRPAVRTDWRRAARAGAIVCPLWFLAQGSYNWSLAGTSVSSSTILSTTSCVFTFALSTLVLKERATRLKVAGVAVTLAGAALVSYGDTTSGNGNEGNTWWGDGLALFSALMYGVYTTAIRRLVPDDGSVDMAVFFGWLGAFNSVLLAPLVGIFHATGVEDLSVLTGTFLMWAALKGAFDNVLSDLLWARAILLTSPTVATLALSLTIPLAMLADLLVHGTRPGLFLVLGSLAVTAGFVMATLALGPPAESVAGPPGAAAERQAGPARTAADDGDAHAPQVSVELGGAVPMTLLSTPVHARATPPAAKRAGSARSARSSRAGPAASVSATSSSSASASATGGGNAIATPSQPRTSRKSGTQSGAAGDDGRLDTWEEGGLTDGSDSSNGRRPPRRIAFVGDDVVDTTALRSATHGGQGRRPQR